jgi:hypothetical protein
MENTEHNPANAAAPGRTEANAPADEVQENIPYNEFKSVKNDMHRFKEDARKAAEELKAFRDKEMRDKEQWKEYSANKEKEANEWKTKYDTLSDSIRDRAKISAVREASLKLGLVETAVDDLELMELKDVIVETTSTGRVNVIGAKSAAERIKSLRPHWFSENRAPNINGRQPEVRTSSGGQTTYEELTKLEKEAVRTGDYTEYKKRMMEFKQRR